MLRVLNDREDIMKKHSYIAVCSGLLAVINTASALPAITNRWLTVEGGYAFSINPNNVSTESMPNINLPDNYVTTGLGNRGLVGVGLGWQFELAPYYSEHAFRSDRLGLMYDYYANGTVSGRIDKYQITPTYSTTYHVNSSVLWVDDQLDLIPIGQFLPFFDVAIGAAWNKTGGYQETPLPLISPQAVRLQSAALASNTSTAFAWRVGVGGNVPITDKLLLGVIYRYASLGKATTGGSANYPTVGGISSNIAANEWVMSLRYNFDTTTAGDMK